MTARNHQLFGVGIIMVTLAGTGGAAQAPPAQSRDRADLRHQVFVMEGALARAVEFGAQRLNRETRAVSPEMVVLAGIAHARGVYLENYGIYFDVGVPILRQSMVWSLKMMLDQDQGGVKDSISVLRADAKKETDPAVRSRLEDAIAVLEARVSPFTSSTRPMLGGGPAPGSRPTLGATVVSDTVAGADPAPPTPPPANPAPMSEIARLFLKDPYRAYTESVQQALMDAMVDYSAPMAIGPDEWLTVAARDNERRDTFAPPDPYEEIVTVVLRIRGADLAAYRTRAIDREEVKRRIQIREF
jgi:hypothetical protein